jgi:hypothetical protein
MAERERRPRVREKTSQPSPTSPSAAALVRRGRDVRFTSTDASVPPGSPPDEGGRERVRARGGEGGRRLPRRRLAPNRSLPPPSPPEPAMATASLPRWVARRLQRARVCGCPNGGVRRGGADGGWGRNGDEIGAVVAKTWPSDATEMDGREGVRYFHAVGRPLRSITVSFIT